MKYTLTLNLPVSASVAYHHYLDRDSMLLWEPGLSSLEDKHGILFEEGSDGYLVFGKLQNLMKMQVSVERLVPSHECVFIYQVSGAWNRCVNTFTDTDEGSQWRMEVEFRFENEPPVPQVQFEEATLSAMKVFRDYLAKLIV